MSKIQRVQWKNSLNTSLALVTVLPYCYRNSIITVLPYCYSIVSCPWNTREVRTEKKQRKMQFWIQRFLLNPNGQIMKMAKCGYPPFTKSTYSENGKMWKGLGFRCQCRAASAEETYLLVGCFQLNFLFSKHVLRGFRDVQTLAEKENSVNSRVRHCQTYK